MNDKDFKSVCPCADCCADRAEVPTNHDALDTDNLATLGSLGYLALAIAVKYPGTAEEGRAKFRKQIDEIASNFGLLKLGEEPSFLDTIIALKESVEEVDKESYEKILLNENLPTIARLVYFQSYKDRQEKAIKAVSMLLNDALSLEYLKCQAIEPFYVVI